MVTAETQHPECFTLFREQEAAAKKRSPDGYSSTVYPASNSSSAQYSDATRLLIHITKPYFEPGELTKIVQDIKSHDWIGDEKIFLTIIAHCGTSEVACEYDFAVEYSPFAAEKLMFRVPSITEIKPGVYKPPALRAKAARKKEKNTEPSIDKYEDTPQGLREVLTQEGAAQAQDFLKHLITYDAGTAGSAGDKWFSDHVIDKLEDRWPVIAQADEAIAFGITTTLRKFVDTHVISGPEKLPRWWLSFAYALAHGHPSAARESLRIAYKAACLRSRGENPYNAVRESLQRMPKPSKKGVWTHAFRQ